jgi:hypothetical protein
VDYFAGEKERLKVRSLMTFKYGSGEEIKKGDRVLFYGNPAEMESVACEFTGDALNDWIMREYGGGIMISDPLISGRTYIFADALEPALGEVKFVSRLDGGPK